MLIWRAGDGSDALLTVEQVSVPLATLDSAAVNASRLDSILTAQDCRIGKGSGVMRGRIRASFDRFRRDRRGTVAIEYGLIATLICVAIILAVSSVGDQLATIFQSIETEFDNAPKP